MPTNCLRVIHLAAWLAVAILGRPATAGESPDRKKIQPSVTFLTRVQAKFEVGGDLRLASDAKPSALPMSATAGFDYFERRIDDGTAAAERRSIRYYADAQATIKVEKQASTAKLAGDHRLVRAAISKDRATLGAVPGYLTREERDLIDLPFNTLLLNDLVPDASAKKGTSWKATESLLAMLLGLDAVSRSDVEIVLAAIGEEVAELAIEGTLDGAVGGVATEITVKGKLHYDIAHRQPFSLMLLIKEKRSVGHAAPGLDVVAKLELKIAPVIEVPQLSDKALAGIELAGGGAEPPLGYQSPTGGFSLVYEPRWRITRDERDGVVMRLVDRGELVAQCNVSVLPKLDAEQPLTLEMFQKEVQQSLGKHFGQFERAAEQRTPTGLRMLHVAALGTVSELPITWHYYILIDETGRRAAISFTMENVLAERFGAADRLVLDEFRLTAATGAASTSAGDDADAAAVKGAIRPRIRIAH